MDLTEDEIAARGEKARALLTSPMFVNSISGFMNDHLMSILASADDDTEGREKHFRLMRNYEAVLHELRNYVDAADKVTAQRMADEATIQDNEDL